MQAQEQAEQQASQQASQQAAQAQQSGLAEEIRRVRQEQVAQDAVQQQQLNRLQEEGEKTKALAADVFGALGEVQDTAEHALRFA